MSADSIPLTPEEEATYYESRGPAVVTGVSLFIGLTTAAVSLRFASRLSRRVGLGVDDWLSVAALIALIGLIVTVIISVHRGMGKHDWAVEDDEWWRILQMELIGSYLNPVARGFVKTTLLFLYRRVFTMNIKWFRYTWYVLLFYVLGESIAGFVSALLQCLPITYSWKMYDMSLNPPAQGSCPLNNYVLAVAFGALTITVEVALFILPITMISQLQLRPPQKIGLMVIFGTGVIAIGAECTRVALTFHGDGSSMDVNWLIANQHLAAVIEDSLGLICACLPTFGPIIVTTKNTITSYISGSSSLQRTISLSGVSHDQSIPQWSPTSVDTIERRGVKASMSTASLEQSPNQYQRGILRTDEYILDTHPRTDDLSFYNYHDPTKPVGNGSVV